MEKENLNIMTNGSDTSVKRLNKVFPEVAFMLNNIVVYYISKHINIFLL